MAHRHSFIPRSHGEYDRFFKNIVQYVAQMCGGSSPQWTHIPQGATVYTHLGEVLIKDKVCKRLTIGRNRWDITGFGRIKK
ncbi:MAG: hypothetical protein LBP74_08275 [Treponema sp.]|jgi:hypothetical protein|nr:hypothetical protein [Treponema sp.]